MRSGYTCRQLLSYSATDLHARPDLNGQEDAAPSVSSLLWSCPPPPPTQSSGRPDHRRLGRLWHRGWSSPLPPPDSGAPATWPMQSAPGTLSFTDAKTWNDKPLSASLPLVPRSSAPGAWSSDLLICLGGSVPSPERWGRSPSAAAHC